MALHTHEYQKIIDYLKMYGNQYSNYALEYLYNNFVTDIDKKIRPDVINQIYAHLGILPDNNNIYKYLLNQLQKYHNINSNILEIGGGYYPTFASYVAKEQLKVGKGKITVYDPKLVTTRLPGIILKKQNFTIKQDISKYDIVTAIMPCQATEVIIEQANYYEKELFLVLCSCTHFDEEYMQYYLSTLQDWENHIRKLIYNGSNKFNITETRIPKKLGNSYLTFHKTLKKKLLTKN